MTRDHEPDAEPRRLARAEAVLRARTRQWCVVLEDAHDPHNISAVLRTCEAFGIQDVHLVAENEPVSFLNPKVTAGAHRWLTLHRHASAEDAIAALRSKGYRLYVSHLDADATPLPHLPGDTCSAYVFGNEKSGVTRRWLQAADATFVIPTSGFSGSLNLSVAVALTVYDRLLGRRGAELPPGVLPADELQALRTEWYVQLAGANAGRRQAYAARAHDPVVPRRELGADRRGLTTRRPRAPRPDHP